MTAVYHQNGKQVLRLGVHIADCAHESMATIIVLAMNERAPPLLRYELRKLGRGYRYGDWHIDPAAWRRPSPSADWDWLHDDYDGAEDAGDHRCGSAASVFDCLNEIHAWEDENDTRPLTENEQAKIDAAWEIHKAAKP